MPRLDRSGPSGAGPRTGNGRGRCGGRQVPATGTGGRVFIGDPPTQGANGRRQCQCRRVHRFVSGADAAGGSAQDLAMRASELRKELAMINARLKGEPPLVNRDRSVE